MRRVSLQTLIALGIKAPHKVVHSNSAKKLQALVNFNLACHYGHLPLQFGFKQVGAFLEMLEQLNYTAETLKLQWAFFRSVIKLSQFQITDRMKNGFDFVLANCKPINDDKMPVSRKLLKQLLKAADKIFQPYNAVLAKAMFLVAWGACMRICEYSFTRAHLPDHNVRRGAILPGKRGLSVEFFSDKVTKLNAAVKHRFVKWKFLPEGAKSIIEQYIKVRPASSKYFFCTNDGRPLRRSHVMDFLESCVLLSDHRFLRILPHGMRSGGASQRRLDGGHILDIKYDGRWTETGKAIDHYTRPNLIDLGPKTVFRERPRYRKKWPVERLQFIINNVIETKGDESHPFLRKFKKYFRDVYASLKNTLITNFPSETTLDRLRRLADARACGLYLRRVVDDEEKKAKQTKYREQIAQAIRARNRSILYGTDTMKAEVAIAAGDIAGHTVSRDVQTIPVSTTDTAAQTDPVHLVYIQPVGDEKLYQALRLNPAGEVELATAPNEELFSGESSENTNPPIIEGVITEGEEVVTQQWHSLASAAVVLIPEVTQEVAKVQRENQIFQQAVVQQFPLMAALVHADLSEPPIERYVGLEQIHAEAKHLFRDANVPARYPAIVKKKRVLLTAAEYSARYPGRKLPYTDETRDRKKVRSRIKRRISVRFRDWETVKKTRTLMRKNKCPEEDLPELPNPTMSTTQVMLVAFFFRQFVYHGSAALPVRRELMDPLEPSNEYGEEVLRAFNDKPPDYELMLTKMLAGRKNSLRYKRENAPSEYALARRKAGKELKGSGKKVRKKRKVKTPDLWDSTSDSDVSWSPSE